MSNVTIPATGSGTATPVIATDTVAGAEYQKVKLDVGAVGATSLVTAANPLPVTNATLPLPTGASTETTLAAQSAKLPATLGQKAMAASLAVVVASDQSAVPISGTVTANAGTNLNTSLLATASKQPALGTAGTASTDVITVQGIAAGTALSTVNPITWISQTPTVSTSPAYTAKDAVGGLLTFANAARVSGGGITIQTVVIVDNSQQMPALDLVLFDRTFTASTDNAIFAPSDADLANTIGTIPVSNWADYSTNSSATRNGLGLTAVLNGTSLFGQLVVRGTPTFVATNDIIVKIGVLQA